MPSARAPSAGTCAGLSERRGQVAFPAPWHTALGHALVVGLLKGGVRGRVLVLTRRFGVDMYVRSGLTAGDASEVVSEPEASKRVRASVAQAILLARSRSEGRRPAREALGEAEGLDEGEDVHVGDVKWARVRMYVWVRVRMWVSARVGVYVDAW